MSDLIILNAPANTLATEAKQDTGNGSLASIKLKTDKIPDDPAKESGKLTTIDTNLAPLTTWVSTRITLTTGGTRQLLPTTEQSGRRILILYNPSAYDIWIGSSAVISTAGSENGIPLPAGGSITLDSGTNTYGVCATSTVAIICLEGK